MEQLTRQHRRASARRAQSGSILLFTLIALLLMFLGALYTFRGAMLDTGLTDKAAARQKDIQVSDLALQQITNTMLTTSAGSVLETSASGQPWFLSTQPSGATTPNAAYWQTCIASPSSTQTCAPISLPTSVPQQAWGFVQPTGRTDVYACHTQGLTAVFYDIWVHVVDPRTHVAADTESLYKLCVAAQ